MNKHLQTKQAKSGKGFGFIAVMAMCLLLILTGSVLARSSNGLFTRAVDYYVGGEDHRAREVLEDILSVDPDNPNARDLYREVGGDPETFANPGSSSRTKNSDQTISNEITSDMNSPAAVAADREMLLASRNTEDTQDNNESFDPVPEDERHQESPTPPDMDAEPDGQVAHINFEYSRPAGREEAVYGVTAQEHDDRVRFTIKATGTVDFIASRIFNPAMIIIDIPNSVNQLPESPLRIGLKDAQRVRHSQYRIKPMNTTRVVIDLEEWNDNYRIYRQAPGNEILVDVFDDQRPREEITDEIDIEDITVERDDPRQRFLLDRVEGQQQEINLEAAAEKPLTIKLTGPDGEPLVGDTVLFEIIRGDGLLDARPDRPGLQENTITDETGRASATYEAARKAGVQVIRASVPEYNLSTVFQLTVKPGDPEEIVKKSGDQQQTTFGSEIPNPLVVEVRDRYGNPVPGVRVSFNDLSGEGLVDIDPDRAGIQTSARSNESGRVNVGFYRTSSHRRENRLEARVFRPNQSDLTTEFLITGHPQLITLNFSRAPMQDVLRTLAEIANLNIAMSDEIDGYYIEDMLISVHLTEVTVLRAFDTILDLKGLSRVADGNIMKIVSKVGATRSGVPVLSPEELDDQYGNNMVTVTYNLRFLEATPDLAGRLENALLAQESSIVADENSNALVITDLVNNQRRIHQVLNQIDQPDQLFEVRVFRLEYRSAENISQNITALLPTGQGNVVPNPATNAVLVFADPSLMDKIENIVSVLDQEGALAESFEVVTLEGYDVDHIAAQVNAVLGLQPVPLSEILDFDIEIEDASDLRQMLEAGRTIEIEALLSSASVIPLSDLNRILLFGPKDIRVMAKRMIEQLKRDAGEYLRQQEWRWLSIHNIPMPEAERLINRMGGIDIQTVLPVSKAFLISADNPDRLDMLEDFMDRIDRNLQIDRNGEILIYSPNYVNPSDLADDLENYYDDLQSAHEEMAGVAAEAAPPRILHSGDDNLILIVSTSEIDFVRGLLRQLDAHLTEEMVVLTYMPQYLDPGELSSQLEDRNIGRLLYQDDNRLSLLVPRANEREFTRIIEDIDSPGHVTRVIYLRHTRAEEIVESLNSIQDNMDLNVTFSHDKPTNSIIFSAPQRSAREIEHIISQLDRWQKQVFIEGVILEYNLSESQDLGIQWFLNPEGAGLDDVDLVSSGDFGARSREGFTAILNREDFQAVFKAVAGLSQSEVLAKPQIMAINGEEAMIRVGDEQQIEISRQTAEGIVTSLEAVEAYTQLTVTPTITSDRFVRMDLQISSDAFSTPGGRAITQTTRRTTNNSVLVRDAQTIVIGGLIQEDEEVSDFGIPFLMDIPVLGHLFKTKSVNTNKRELVVFLTPHVIENPSEAERTTQRVSDELRQITPVPVNINLASASRLARIQGLGPDLTDQDRLQLARRIVRYREQHGPFLTYSEMERIPGIDQQVISNIIYRSELRVDLNTVSVDDLISIRNIEPEAAQEIIDLREQERLFQSLTPVRELLLEAGVSEEYYNNVLRDLFYVTAIQGGEIPSDDPSPTDSGGRETLPVFDDFEEDETPETLPELPQE